MASQRTVILLIPGSDFDENAVLSNSILTGFLATPANVVLPAIRTNYIQYHLTNGASNPLKIGQAYEMIFFLTPVGDAALVAGLAAFSAAIGYSYVTWSVTLLA